MITAHLRVVASAAVVSVTLACNASPKPSQPDTAPSSAAPRALGRTLVVSPELLTAGRIVVAPVVRAAPRNDLTVTGEVMTPPDGAAEIGAPISGRVREILVKEGDRVSAGATLATLDAAEAARTAMDLGRAEAKRARAERVLQQEQQLMQGNATSARNLAEATSELKAAQVEERGAKELLTHYGAASGARVLVKTPIRGIVLLRNIVLGKPVETGAPMFRVVDTGKLLIRADVPENDAADIHDGMEATLAWPARKLFCSGTVESRAPSLDSATRTLPFRVRPGASCPTLVEGGFVDVTLPRPAVPGAQPLLSVPRDALVEMDAVPVVFVALARPGEFRAATVRVAHVSSSIAYIEDGLSQGDSVVVTGAILLKGELMRSALE
jgi:membrane fusion protein, heavy metal efflux system